VTVFVFIGLSWNACSLMMVMYRLAAIAAQIGVTPHLVVR
jgi:hypothetical protein